MVFGKWYKLRSDIEEKRNYKKRVVLYRTMIGSGDLVFDIGANVGNRVKSFLEIGASVVAVEPQPACANTLRQKFAGKISLEEVGLSDHPGMLEMMIADESTISTFSQEFVEKTQGSRFRHNKWEKKISVPVTTLDTLIGKYGVPQFCKIDVEGYELNVLKGLSQPIPYVSFEYCVPEMSEAMKKCIDQLARLSSKGLFNYCVAESMELSLSQWMPYEDFLKHVSSASFESTLFGDIYFKA
jgi:FkbM family methyltransferase